MREDRDREEIKSPHPRIKVIRSGGGGGTSFFLYDRERTSPILKSGEPRYIGATLRKRDIARVIANYLAGA